MNQLHFWSLLLVFAIAALILGPKQLRLVAENIRVAWRRRKEVNEPEESNNQAQLKDDHA